MSEYLLEMEHMRKEFPGVRALDDVTLRVRPGSIHALMGENGAGKSTLMKCLFGIYTPDGGVVRLDGREVRFRSSRQALEHGVAMVHQELNQVNTRPVMENIWLGRFPRTRLGTVDGKVMEERTAELLRSLELDADPSALIGTLPVSVRQMVEIAKALSYGSRVIVLDEPTSSLSETEAEQLFRILRRLRGEGCGIIYISHKMSEILSLADEVTVMRDGKNVATQPAEGLTMDVLIRQMVGRSLTNAYPPKHHRPGGLLLEAEGITARDGHPQDVSFQARRGEVLGFAGLLGAGRTELMECLFGLRELAAGEIRVNGKPVRNPNPRAAKRNGFALLTEERRKSGILGVLSIRDNATAANLRRYLRGGLWLDGKRMERDTDWVIRSMRVKTPSQRTPIRTLSGGNQQKVILGRWLLTQPEILLLDEPTRGVDVGAKYEIYQLILELASEGRTVLMVSSEMPELLGVCDRILVMSNGRVAGEADPSTASQEEILRLAGRFV